MICQRIGRPPISIIGLGLKADSSDMRVPKPPARMTTFIKIPNQSSTPERIPEKNALNKPMENFPLTGVKEGDNDLPLNHHR